MKKHFPVSIFLFLNRVCDSLVISSGCYWWWSVDDHLCWRALSSSLLFKVTGHNCESVDVTHSGTSTKGLLCVWIGGWSPIFRQLGQYWKPCVPWGGVSVWRRGGQGERCGLLCSICFKTLILHRWIWASLRAVYIDFHSFSIYLFGLAFTSTQFRPAVNTEPRPWSFFHTSRRMENTSVISLFVKVQCLKQSPLHPAYISAARLRR